MTRPTYQGLRKNKPNPFGVVISGDVTAQQSKTVMRLMNDTNSPRMNKSGHFYWVDRKTTEIFPALDIYIPSHTEMRAYLASDVVKKNHATPIVTAFRRSDFWKEMKETGRKENVGPGPTYFHTTKLTPADLVHIVGGGVPFVHDIDFIAVTREFRSYETNLPEMHFRLKMTKWEMRDPTVPLGLFELGLWWSHAMPREFPHSLFTVGEVAYMFGGDVSNTRFSTTPGDQIANAVRSYRHFRNNRSTLFWMMAASSVGEKRNLVDAALDIYSLSQLANHREVIAAMSWNLSISDMLMLKKNNFSLDQSAPYLATGVNQMDRIADFIAADVDPELAFELLNP
jgi:hypothetical protein